MPNFDYECSSCDTVQEYWRSPFTETVECRDCGAEAKWQPSFYYSSNAQSFTPTVIFRDREGNLPDRPAMGPHTPTPPGFERLELTTTRQIRQFERKIAEEQAEIAHNFENARQKYRDGQLQASREAVDEIRRGGAWSGLDSEGRVITRHGLSKRGERFLDSMRAISIERQSHSVRPINPAFFVEAFSNQESKTRY